MKGLSAEYVNQSIQDFLASKLSTQTVRQYRPQLCKFSDWLRDQGFISGDQFHVPTAQDILEYLSKLHQEDVPLTMRREALVAIRSWFDFLGREGFIKDNPAARIKNPILAKRLYRPLTEKQVQSAFDSIGDKNSYWPARDKAIFEVIYEDALIAEEVCALNVADVLWKLRAISVKGTRLPMESTLVDALRIYLAERDALFLHVGIDPNSTPALFVEKRGNWNAERRLGPHNLAVILKRIDPLISPSKLRDACGIHMLNHGADPRIVSALYGIGIHAISRLQDMSSAKPRELLKKSHPRATLPQTGCQTVD